MPLAARGSERGGPRWRAHLGGLPAVLLTACAWLTTGGPPQPISVWVRSHNRSAVDIYLACGRRDSQWVGSVEAKGAEAFDLPGVPYCIQGLSFFVVVQESGWGYWVGPIRPEGPVDVDLLIEKYAGNSMVAVRRHGS
jgi:hypothetical protein